MDLSFLGGLGIGGVAGSAVTNWINRWLEGRSERARWLRDRRHAAYSALAKELLSMSIWSGRSASDIVVGLAAEAILLMDDAALADRIEEHFSEVQRARDRVAGLGGDLKERDRRSEIEYGKLKQDAREIVDALKSRMLK